jgi:hypothetical protein
MTHGPKEWTGFAPRNWFALLNPAQTAPPPKEENGAYLENLEMTALFLARPSYL